jgi:hypothetical protein
VVFTAFEDSQGLLARQVRRKSCYRKGRSKWRQWTHQSQLVRDLWVSERENVCNSHKQQTKHAVMWLNIHEEISDRYLHVQNRNKSSKILCCRSTRSRTHAWRKKMQMISPHTVLLCGRKLDHTRFWPDPRYKDLFHCTWYSASSATCLRSHLLQEIREKFTTKKH